VVYSLPVFHPRSVMHFSSLRLPCPDHLILFDSLTLLFDDYNIDQRFPNCGAPPRGHCSLGAQVVCMRGIFILDKIWAQDIICILVDTLLG
jgi:hypothetical protein